MSKGKHIPRHSPRGVGESKYAKPTKAYQTHLCPKEDARAA